MANWKEYKLDDIVDSSRGVSYGVVQPGTFQKKDGVPILKVNNLTEGKFSIEDADKISEEVESKYSRTRLTGNEILVSVVGSLGYVFRVTEKQIGWNVVRALAVLPIKEGISKDWVFYCLKSPNVQNEFIQRAMHTVQATLNLKELRGITIPIPDITTQNAIAEILSSLDDKIELNNKINANLEALAQALFKQWFVDFEFPNENGHPYKSSGGEMVESELGEIPNGWNVTPIGNLFDMVVGGDWGKDEIDNEHTEMMYVVRGTDLPELKQGTIGKIPYRAIKPSKLKNRQLQSGDIIIEISGGSKDQPTGRNLLITEEILERLNYSAIPASFCRLIRPKVGYKEFLGIYLTSLYDDGKTWEYQNQSTGISNFQFKYFETNEILAIPSEIKLIERFSSIASSIYSQMTSNENIELVKLRDRLLPKLISGELEVTELLTEKVM